MIFSPSPVLYALAAAVMLGGAFVTGVRVEKGAEARREVQRREDARIFEAENRRLERKWYDNATGAVNESRKREQVIQVDSAGSRSELDSLRNDLAAARAGLSSTSLDACRLRVATLTDVFEQCASRYQGVAGQADAHASDTLTLEQAWPQR